MDNLLVKMALKKPDINKAKRILAIQPHADDNEIAAGGAIKAFIDKGIEVIYLTITDGSLGQKDGKYTKEELKNIRENECREAGRFLGVDEFHFLNYEDGTLSDILKLTDDIALKIRELKPDFILAPDPYLEYEAHYDHIVTGKAASGAILKAELYNKDYPSHSTKGIAYYFTSKPNTIIDITDTFSDQLKSIGIHKTQVDKKTLALFSIYFKEIAKKVAKDEKFKLGCGLKVLGPLHLHCYQDANNV